MCVFFILVCVCVFLSFIFFELGFDKIFGTSQRENSPYSSFTFTDLSPHPPTPPISRSFKPVPFEKFIRIDREPLFEEDSQKLNGRGKNGQQMGRMHSASIYHQVGVFGGRIKGGCSPFTS